MVAMRVDLIILVVEVALALQVLVVQVYHMVAPAFNILPSVHFISAAAAAAQVTLLMEETVVLAAVAVVQLVRPQEVLVIIMVHLVVEVQQEVIHKCQEEMLAQTLAAEAVVDHILTLTIKVVKVVQVL
jgi:hypothetical protein